MNRLMTLHKIPWLPFVLAGLSLLGTLYMNFTHNDRENAQKISALESRRVDDSARLDRIETKLDRPIW